MVEKLPIKIAIAIVFVVGVWFFWPSDSSDEETSSAVSALESEGKSEHKLVSTIQPISQADAASSSPELSEAELEKRFLNITNTIKTGDIDRAITELNGLIADYPQVIEPYINLASLYADDGQLDLSRNTLERAIKANPNTATLFESVQTVYGAQAAKAYRLALNDQQEAAQQLPQPKVSLPLIESIDTREARASIARNSEVKQQLDVLQADMAEASAEKTLLQEKLAAAQTSHNAELASLREQLDSQTALNQQLKAREESLISLLEQQNPGVDAVSLLANTENSSTRLESERLAELAASEAAIQNDADEQAKTALLRQQREEAEKAAAAEAQSKSVLRVAQGLVKSWAKYWSEQNVDGYVSHYAQNYVPQGSGLTHAQWLEQRQVRLTNKRFINVDVSEFSVQDEPNQFVVTFTQHYQSNTVDDTIRKRLVFEKLGANLEDAKIVGEQVVRR